jgi:hypothetical protein
MVERGIEAVRIESPTGENAAQTRQRLSALFPRGALRRMTQLGMLIGSVLDGWEPAETDAIYYASAHAEAKSLEDYLRSFPLASPLLFQTSVHPSAVQQVLIGRQQAVGRYVPMAGERMVVEQALVAALVDPAPRVIFTGGEEQGTWLAAAGAAAPDSFAFALTLVAGRGSLGGLQFTPGRTSEPAPGGLRGFALSLAAREPLDWSGPAGSFRLAWH